jgi:hypothetical protein
MFLIIPFGGKMRLRHLRSMAAFIPGGKPSPRTGYASMWP